MTFYVYRAQTDDDYPPENVNVADLAGVMWYLHNEVVPSTPRKFALTRVIRYRLTVRNTAEFFDTYPKQFSNFVAFDSGQCTAPHCSAGFERFGPVVGCQNLDRNVANYARGYRAGPKVGGAADGGMGVRIRKLSDHEGADGNSTRNSTKGGAGRPREEADGASASGRAGHRGLQVAPTITDSYKSGIWYSLPGPCSGAAVGQKSADCVAQSPGGAACAGGAVNGSRSCTYSYSYAGEVRIDDLSGILDPSEGISTYDDFWKNSVEHCLSEVASGLHNGPCPRRMEYNTLTDKGEGCSFWDGKHDTAQGLRRMNRVRELFREKYPYLPDDYTEPDCL